VVKRLIVCILLDLLDLTTMPVGIDFNSPRLTAAIRLAGSTGRYHLAVAGGSIPPEMRCVYPPATARWYWPAPSDVSISATMDYTFTSVITVICCWKTSAFSGFALAIKQTQR